jgi:hydrogenase maturation protease
MSERILIACIGNIFLGDDGFGVEVARELSAMQLSSDVKLVDFGIRGLDLAYALLHPWQAVVMVDAVKRGGPPGTLYLMQPSNTAPVLPCVDPHAVDPMRVLSTAKSIGQVNAELYILGCEPGDFGDEYEGRMGLSLQVQAAVPEAASMVREMVSRLEQRTARECTAH